MPTFAGSVLESDLELVDSYIESVNSSAKSVDSSIYFISVGQKPVLYIVVSQLPLSNGNPSTIAIECH